jgi:hypothetical protein
MSATKGRQSFLANDSASSLHMWQKLKLHSRRKPRKKPHFGDLLFFVIDFDLPALQRERLCWI